MRVGARAAGGGDRKGGVVSGGNVDQRESTSRPQCVSYVGLGTIFINITGDHIKYQVGPTVHTKAYIFRYFYQQFLVLLTMAPRDSAVCTD